jgi:hypothetical protein
MRKYVGETINNKSKLNKMRENAEDDRKKKADNVMEKEN